MSVVVGKSQERITFPLLSLMDAAERDSFGFGYTASNALTTRKLQGSLLRRMSCREDDLAFAVGPCVPELISRARVEAGHGRSQTDATPHGCAPSIKAMDFRRAFPEVGFRSRTRHFRAFHDDGLLKRGSGRTLRKRLEQKTLVRNCFCVSRAYI